MDCRNCKKPLNYTLIDLGSSPPSNAFLSQSNLSESEEYLPLEVKVCKHCFLVQLGEIKSSKEIFNEDYIYYSSFSTSWLAHAQSYVEMIIKRLNLGSKSFVVEVASNDGYLLKNFIDHKIPHLGVEPTEGTAKVARSSGVETIVEFFGAATASKIVELKGKADLTIGNNVIAHVPDLHDFLEGFRIILKENGTATFEFPHLLELMKYHQFDTIYHEHFSYLSLISLTQALDSHKLRIYHAEKIPTHGGSLRIYVSHVGSGHPQEDSVERLLEEERNYGLDNLSTYEHFSINVRAIKLRFLKFLTEQIAAGKKVYGYGAAAKGNTFLNYAGVKADIFGDVADASTIKQGKFLPGSRIKVISPKDLLKKEPDYVVIFPWNLRTEIVHQLKGELKTGTRLVTFIPEYLETVI
jgi:hypothetical protein